MTDDLLWQYHKGTHQKHLTTHEAAFLLKMALTTGVDLIRFVCSSFGRRNRNICKSLRREGTAANDPTKILYYNKYIGN